LNRNGERQPNCLLVISKRINNQILSPAVEDFPQFAALSFKYDQLI